MASGKVQVSQKKRDVSLKLETYMMTIQYRTSISNLASVLSEIRNLYIG